MLIAFTICLLTACAETTVNDQTDSASASTAIEGRFRAPALSARLSTLDESNSTPLLDSTSSQIPVIVTAGSPIPVIASASSPIPIIASAISSIPVLAVATSPAPIGSDIVGTSPVIVAAPADNQIQVAQTAIAKSPAAGITASLNNNYITVRNFSKSSQADVPFQIGRAFIKGEIRSAPALFVNALEIESQSDVKTRWPDGSVKFAVVSFYISNIASNESLVVRFGNKDIPSNAAGLSKDQMSAPSFNFDAQIRMLSAGNAGVTVSALQMLKAGHYKVWAAGPIATTVVLADHTSQRTFDLGLDQIKSFRPIFHATFWPKVNKVRVRLAGEVSNTQMLRDMTYDVELTVGNSTPKVVYQKSAVIHHTGARWSRSAWINGAPSTEVGVDHNIGYLAQTLAIPNYNPSVKVSDVAIDQTYAKWVASSRGILDAGGWQKYMPGGGGRPDIGLTTTWHALWLYSANPKAAEMALGQSDLAGAWPMHFREGDATKYFDAARKVPAIGLPVSLFGRPTMMTALGNRNIQSGDTAAADKVQFVGATSDQGWYPDGSHQPDAFSISYLLTGDPWYLEQMQFWASWGAMTSLATLKTNWGRGPTMTSGNIGMLEPRHQAWTLQARLTAAWHSPDVAPEKAYFSKLTVDALAVFEGMRGVANPKYGQTPEFAWGATEGRTMYGTNGVKSPMGAWDTGHPGYASNAYGPFIAGTLGTATATWQDYFVVLAIARAKDYGFEADSLLRDTVPFLTKQINDAGADPFWSGCYVVPLTYPSGKYLNSISEASAVTKSTYIPKDDFYIWVKDVPNNLDHGYPLIAASAASVARPYDQGDRTWQFYVDNVVKQVDFSFNPKWALLPR